MTAIVNLVPIHYKLYANLGLTLIIIYLFVKSLKFTKLLFTQNKTMMFEQ